MLYQLSYVRARLDSTAGVRSERRRARLTADALKEARWTCTSSS
jgi:hypothetical protein